MFSLRQTVDRSIIVRATKNYSESDAVGDQGGKSVTCRFAGVGKYTRYDVAPPWNEKRISESVETKKQRTQNSNRF